MSVEIDGKRSRVASPIFHDTKRYTFVIFFNDHILQRINDRIIGAWLDPNRTE